MSRPAHLLLVCRAAVAAGIGTGLVALALPPRTTTDDPLPPALAPLPARGAAPASLDDSMPDLIVSRNLFSPGRQPPRTRAMLDGDRADGGAAGGYASGANGTLAGDAPTDAPVGENAAGGGDADGVPALHGVVDGPWGRAALLRLVPSAPGARLYREGEREGPWRVRHILVDRVVLDGPWGDVIARLPQPGSRGAAGAGTRPEAP